MKWIDTFRLLEAVKLLKAKENVLEDIYAFLDFIFGIFGKKNFGKKRKKKTKSLYRFSIALSISLLPHIIIINISIAIFIIFFQF